MSEDNPTTSAASGKPAKPNKPYPEFPLTAHHGAKQWCKKIRGKVHYFGKLDDPDAALDSYNRQKDDLHAGLTPRPDPHTLTIKQLANAYMKAKAEAVAAGELAQRTHDDYYSIMKMMGEGLGPQRLVADLRPQDFAALKVRLAKRNGPARMSTVIQVIRCAFKHAYESLLIGQPVRFGPAFKRPSKKTLRLHRAKQKAKEGAKLFTAEEIRRMLSALAGEPFETGLKNKETGEPEKIALKPNPVLRAMVLLGINCGFGNADCGSLPISAVDLDTGIIDFPRPKTGIPRRCPLWPETVEAIREALAVRPKPKKAEHACLCFITKYGDSWAKTKNSGPLHHEMKKLLDKLHINGRSRLGHYTLRHTHRTVGDGAKDQRASNAIMGHEDGHMSATYVEHVGDDRLRAVSDHVRNWLFGELVR